MSIMSQIGIFTCIITANIKHTIETMCFAMAWTYRNLPVLQKIHVGQEMLTLSGTPQFTPFGLGHS